MTVIGEIVPAVGSVRQAGWKFRAKGEFAHFFSICRRDDCKPCGRLEAHAFCNEGITVSLVDLPALSRSQPPHRACPTCVEIVKERDTFSYASWRVRAAMKPLLRPRWLARA